MWLKNINLVLRFKHLKELTISFFPADGTKMMSTCIDNKTRIFNTKKFNSDATSKLVNNFNVSYSNVQYIIWVSKYEKAEAGCLVETTYTTITTLPILYQHFR